MDEAIREFFETVEAQMRLAQTLYGDMHDAHQGYGVLAEEVAEFFEEVRKNPGKRNGKMMYIELAQVAAVAARIALQVASDDEAIRR